jgi:hypothetical protein
LSRLFHRPDGAKLLETPPLQGISWVWPDGSLFSYYNYGITRSQDEGQTWEEVLSAATGFDYQFNTHCFTVSPEGRIFPVCR